MTLTECFAHFGVSVNNSRDAPWSKQAQDGTVVATLWSRKFLDSDRKLYSSGTHKPSTISNRKNKLRIEHFQHARDRNTAIFQSIIVTATTRTRNKFELGARMRLTDLDERTGEFRAERATGWASLDAPDPP
jgi:hypothetical protein